MGGVMTIPKATIPKLSLAIQQRDLSCNIVDYLYPDNTGPAKSGRK